MVTPAGISTGKLNDTAVAGKYWSLPDWFAVMVQMPASKPLTRPLVASTEQMAGVSVLKDTAKPDVAVAVMVALPPKVRVGAVPNEMV